MGDLIQLIPKHKKPVTKQLSLSRDTIYDLRVLVADWFRCDDAHIEIQAYDYNKLRLKITPLDYDWDSARYATLGRIRWFFMTAFQWRVMKPKNKKFLSIVNLKQYTAELSDMIRSDTGIFTTFIFRRDEGVVYESI